MCRSPPRRSRLMAKASRERTPSSTSAQPLNRCKLRPRSGRLSQCCMVEVAFAHRSTRHENCDFGLTIRYTTLWSSWAFTHIRRKIEQNGIGRLEKRTPLTNGTSAKQEDVDMKVQFIWNWGEWEGEVNIECSTLLTNFSSLMHALYIDSILPWYFNERVPHVHFLSKRLNIHGKVEKITFIETQSCTEILEIMNNWNQQLSVAAGRALEADTMYPSTNWLKNVMED